MSNWSDTQWTKPVVERFKVLLKIRPWPGYPVIADALSLEFRVPFSKNACIGKARRDKLAPKLRATPGGKRGEYDAGKPIVRPPPRKRPLPAPPPRKDRKVTFWELEPHHCRWPSGDDPPYLYCGMPKFADCSYCFRHASIAFPGIGKARL